MKLDPRGSPRALLRPFLLAAIGYLLVAALVGTVIIFAVAAGSGAPFGLRLAHVHLALLGSVSQAMLGAMPFFSIALLATLPPNPRIVRLQWWLANAGVVLLSAGFVTGWPVASLAGGIGYLSGAVLAGWTVYQMARRSAIRRVDIYYYLAAFGYGLVAMLLGVLLVSGVTERWVNNSSLRLAHLHLALVGWVSLTIVGTMYSLFPSILGARVGSARILRVNFALLTAGVAGLVIGQFGLLPLAIGGGLAILIATFLFESDVLRARLEHRGSLPLAGKHLFAAAACFVLTALGGMALLLWLVLGRSVDARWLVAYGHLAAVGWIGQTLVGAMVHLIPVMAGGRPGTKSGGHGRSYADWSAALARLGGTQLGLFNGGLALFAASLLFAPAFAPWPLFVAGGGLAMLGAFGLFGYKVLCLVTKRPV